MFPLLEGYLTCYWSTFFYSQCIAKLFIGKIRLMLRLPLYLRMHVSGYTQRHWFLFLFYFFFRCALLLLSFINHKLTPAGILTVFLLHRIFQVHSMMLQWQKPWNCTRSKTVSGLFLKLQPLKEKGSLRAWIGKINVLMAVDSVMIIY